MEDVGNFTGENTSRSMATKVCTDTTNGLRHRFALDANFDGKLELGTWDTQNEPTPKPSVTNYEYTEGPLVPFVVREKG